MGAACVTGLAVHFPESCRTAAAAVVAAAAAAGQERRQMTDGEGEAAKKSLVGRCQPLRGRNE